MTKKKVIRNFGRQNGIFFLKERHSEISVCEICFRQLKLGVRSPPIDYSLKQRVRDAHLHLDSYQLAPGILITLLVYNTL